MHKTKNTYLFEREYDKENSGVVDEALKFGGNGWRWLRLPDGGAWLSL